MAASKRAPSDALEKAKVEAPPADPAAPSKPVGDVVPAPQEAVLCGDFTHVDVPVDPAAVAGADDFDAVHDEPEMPPPPEPPSTKPEPKKPPPPPAEVEKLEAAADFECSWGTGQLRKKAGDPVDDHLLGPGAVARLRAMGVRLRPRGSRTSDEFAAWARDELPALAQNAGSDPEQMRELERQLEERMRKEWERLPQDRLPRWARSG